MKLSTKVKIAIVTFIITGFSLLFLMEMSSLKNYLDNSSKIVIDEHVETTVNVLENTLCGLYTTTSKIASNSKIIELLESSNRNNGITMNEIQTMRTIIGDFEGIMSSATFVSGINIASLQGKFIFSQERFFEGFILEERPWFNEVWQEMEENLYRKSISTPVHRDYNTGEFTISIVSPILSQSQELIGVAIIDIKIGDLIEYLNNTFYLGDVSTFINIGDFYYDGEELVKGDFSSKGNEIFIPVVNDDIYLENLDVIFKFNVDSLAYYEKAEEY
ncbi:MAG: cache domain-containing protein, partial [Clostridium sp.]